MSKGMLVLIGLAHLAAYVSAATTTYTWPVVHPGPFGNVPRLSLPGALGPLLQYQTEWWYLAGALLSDDGEKFTVQVQILRTSECSPLIQMGAALGGIGRASTQEYVWEQSYGYGLTQVDKEPGPYTCLAAQPPTDTDFQLRFRPNLHGNGSMALWYDYNASKGHMTGEQGATYHVQYNGTQVSLSCDLVDVRGTVMEGVNGIISQLASTDPNSDVGSYEWAQPVMRPVKGILTFKGRRYNIVGGNLWHDRQFTTKAPSAAPPVCQWLENVAGKIETATQVELKKILDYILSHLPNATKPAIPSHSAGRLLLSSSRLRFSTRRLAQSAPKPAAQKQLYVGNWIGLVFNNNVSMALAFFWQKVGGGQQWISGTKVGRPPWYAFGTIYHSYADASLVMEYQSGVTPLGAKDIDLNILNPKDPKMSPHWTSKVSNQTYSTAWELTLNRKKLSLTPSGQKLPSKVYIFSLVDSAECLLPDVSNAFGEGAAAVYADPGKKNQLGWAFMEQMGFTN